MQFKLNYKGTILHPTLSLRFSFLITICKENEWVKKLGGTVESRAGADVLFDGWSSIPYSSIKGKSKIPSISTSQCYQVPSPRKYCMFVTNHRLSKYICKIITISSTYPLNKYLMSICKVQNTNNKEED